MKKLINLFEESKYREYPEYEKILGKDTEDLLKSKAASRYGEKPENRASPGQVYGIINAIMEAEKGYTDILSDLAVTLVKEIIPAIDYFDLEIDAKIGNDLELKDGEPPKFNIEKIKNPDLDDSDKDKMRRLKNALSQGGSVYRLEFKIFKEFFDSIDEDLLEKYEEFAAKMFTGIYQSESMVQSFVNMLKNMPGAGAETGWSEVLVPESDDDDDDTPEKITIKARAKCFPILVHEIIKGFLSYLADQVSADALGDEEEEQAERETRQKVDTYINEPRDIMYGQNVYRIYDSFFKGLEEQTRISDSRLIDVFLSEMYLEYEKKPAEFNLFINNMLNGSLTPEQLNWAKTKYTSLAKQLKDYDRSLLQGDETYDQGDELAEQRILSEEDELMTLQRELRQYEKIFKGIMNFDPTDLALESLSTIDEDVDEIIRKRGNRYDLYSHSGKKLGAHTSRKKALRQERAIYANKNESATKQCSCQHKHD